MFSIYDPKGMSPEQVENRDPSWSSMDVGARGRT